MSARGTFLKSMGALAAPMGLWFLPSAGMASSAGHSTLSAAQNCSVEEVRAVSEMAGREGRPWKVDWPELHCRVIPDEENFNRAAYRGWLHGLDYFCTELVQLEVGYAQGMHLEQCLFVDSFSALGTSMPSLRMAAQLMSTVAVETPTPRRGNDLERIFTAQAKGARSRIDDDRHAFYQGLEARRAEICVDRPTRFSEVGGEPVTASRCAADQFQFAEKDRLTPGETAVMELKAIRARNADIHDGLVGLNSSFAMFWTDDEVRTYLEEVGYRDVLYREKERYAASFAMAEYPDVLRGLRGLGNIIEEVIAQAKAQKFEKKEERDAHKALVEKFTTFSATVTKAAAPLPSAVHLCDAVDDPRRKTVMGDEVPNGLAVFQEDCTIWRLSRHAAFKADADESYKALRQAYMTGRNKRLAEGRLEQATEAVIRAQQALQDNEARQIEAINAVSRSEPGPQQDRLRQEVLNLQRQEASLKNALLVAQAQKSEADEDVRRTAALYDQTRRRAQGEMLD